MLASFQHVSISQPSGLHESPTSKLGYRMVPLCKSGIKSQNTVTLLLLFCPGTSHIQCNKEVLWAGNICVMFKNRNVNVKCANKSWLAWSVWVNRPLERRKIAGDKNIRSVESDNATNAHQVNTRNKTWNIFPWGFLQGFHRLGFDLELVPPVVYLDAHDTHFFCMTVPLRWLGMDINWLFPLPIFCKLG